MAICCQFGHQLMPPVVWESVRWCAVRVMQQYAMSFAQLWAGDNLT